MIDLQEIEYLDFVEYRGKKIKKTDFITLKDFVSNDILKTGFWDSQKFPFEDISVPSEKDFKSIFYLIKDERFNEIYVHKVHRVLSLSSFRIDNIGSVGGEYFLFTNNLLVQLNNSLEVDEFTLDSLINKELGISELDISLIEKISGLYLDYEHSLIGKEELTDILSLNYSLYINSQVKWGINNMKSINGKFYPNRI